MTLQAAVETYQAFSRRSVVLEPLSSTPTSRQLEDAAEAARTYGAAIVDAGDPDTGELLEEVGEALAVAASEELGVA